MSQALEITVIANGTETQHFIDQPKTANQLLASAAFTRQFGVASNSIVRVNGESGEEHEDLASGDVLEFSPRSGTKG